MALIPYLGGKSRLAKTIISKMPEHTCYVEVFAGGASVFFKKPPSPSEIINDMDKDLITLYRVVKNHQVELHRQFELMLVSRSEFERLRDTNPETLTDIQRAARYLYLQRTCFGAHTTGRTFATVTTGRNPQLNLFTLQETLHEAWLRLAHAQIECMDFRQLIPRYDRAHTLFYLDPPYWKMPYYVHNLEEQDFVDLAVLLTGIKGKFMMSINDTPEVRDIFGHFTIEEVQLKYSASRETSVRNDLHTELLINNF